MAKLNLDKINIDSLKYKKLSLNDKARVLNRQMYAFENEQLQQIHQYTESLKNVLVAKGDIHTPAGIHIAHAIAKVEANLDGLMYAKSHTEMKLYYNSIMDALKYGLKPESKFELEMNRLQAYIADITYTRKKENIDAIQTYLNKIKWGKNKEIKEQIESVRKQLENLATTSVDAFEDKKEIILGQLDKRKRAQPSFYDHCLLQISHAANNIYITRGGYLLDQDKTRFAFINRMFDKTEALAVGTGDVLSAASDARNVIAKISSPALKVGLQTAIGIAGLVYSAVDVGTKIGSLISEKQDVKVGIRENPNTPKPKPSYWQGFKNIVKKAAPLTLSILGVGFAIGAIVATGGILGAVMLGGVAVCAVGATYISYRQRKEEHEHLKQAVALHKSINEEVDLHDSTTLTEQLLHRQAYKKLAREAAEAGHKKQAVPKNIVDKFQVHSESYQHRHPKKQILQAARSAKKQVSALEKEVEQLDQQIQQANLQVTQLQSTVTADTSDETLKDNFHAAKERLATLIEAKNKITKTLADAKQEQENHTLAAHKAGLTNEQIQQEEDDEEGEGVSSPSIKSP